ncbi:MAG: Deoxyribodipyrimidine photolyase [Candidatus Parcubacteria bacterium]|jgi:deoxyribodipyrimidine photo-lyase
MSVNPLRVKKHTTQEYTNNTVVYQMCRDIRAHDNDALLFAQELAKSKGAQLIVNYVIWNYEWEGATRRFYDWVLPSLQEVEKEVRSKNIPLIIALDNEKLFTKKHGGEIPSSLGAVVIDQLPLHFMKKWKELFIKHHPDVPLYEVDAHNCIPVWELSPKQEFAARTIRSKVHAKLPLFLEDYSELHYHDANKNLLETIPAISWDEVTSKIICNEKVKGTGAFVPGTQEGLKTLDIFLRNKLATYDTDRNNFDIDGQSNLSPYITHGNISRRRILLGLLKKTGVNTEEAFDSVQNGSNGRLGSVAAFIEECVVRAELCDNFCFYNPNYDSYEGFPSWAKETLNKARADKREYLYTLEEFKQAKTHDNIWNAAQLQMVNTGKMHGYMRMYWAKKILEWTSTPEEAMRVAVYLNDTYELDGRDPNGYVGCAWSIGGVHDRPWFGRPVFGAIRYMAKSGVEKRGDIKAYERKWLGGEQSLL